MSLETQLSAVEAVVFHALRGKYGLADETLTNDLIRPLAAAIWSASDTQTATRVRTVSDDIRNQVLVLKHIENEWVREPAGAIDLDRIHRALMPPGQGDDAIRSTEFVADFEGVPPAALSELTIRKKEIDELLAIVDGQRLLSLDDKAVYLARLLSRIIAAHVFADGNGRAGRIAVQYCLRRWGLAFAPIPKVRNAPGWKSALHAAMGGDLAGLTHFLARLISGEDLGSVERSMAPGSRG